MIRDFWPRWLLLFSLAINVAVIGTVVYIHYFVGPRPFVVHFAEKRIMLDDPRLNLSENQKREFQRLQEQFLGKIDKDFPGFHEERMKMVQTLSDPAFDDNQVQKTADEVRAFQNQFHEEWIQYLLSLRSVLNEEQQVTFGKVLRERLEFPLQAPGKSGPPAFLQK